MTDSICGYDVSHILGSAGKDAGLVYKNLLEMRDTYSTYEECVTYIEAVLYLGCDPYNYGDWVYY